VQLSSEKEAVEIKLQRTKEKKQKLQSCLDNLSKENSVAFSQAALSGEMSALKSENDHLRQLSDN